MNFQFKSMSLLQIAITLSIFSFLGHTDFVFGMKRKRNTYESQDRNKQTKNPAKDLAKKDEETQKKRKIQEWENYEENRKIFLQAIHNRDTAKMETLLKLFPELVNENGRVLSNTILKKDLIFEASKKGHTEVVKFFLCKGVPIYSRDDYKNTLLHIASGYGHLDIVKHLVARKANINAVDQYEETPLHKTFENFYLKIVKFLISQGTSIRSLLYSKLLFFALEEEDDELKEFLKSKKKKIKKLDEIIREYGEDILLWASELGYTLTIEYLLSEGVDVNTNNGYYTPLELALENQELEAAEFLISQGADVNIHDNFSKSTLLNNESVCADLESVKLLVLQGGADVNTRDMYGLTPLHKETHYNTVKFLVSQGANVCAKSYGDEWSDDEYIFSGNFTPQNLASIKGHIEIEKFLEQAERNQREIEKSTYFITNPTNNLNNTIIEQEMQRIIERSDYAHTPTFAIQNALIYLVEKYKKNPKAISKASMLCLCKKIPFNTRFFSNECKNLREFIREQNIIVRDINDRTIQEARKIFCKEQKNLKETTKKPSSFLDYAKDRKKRNNNNNLWRLYS